MNGTTKQTSLAASNAARRRLVAEHREEYAKILTEERALRGLFALPSQDPREKAIRASIERLKKVDVDTSDLEALLES